MAPKKHQHSTCIFCSEKIVLLKREVYCTMFTQTALSLLINKHYFENDVWAKASYLVDGYFIIAGKQNVASHRRQAEELS
jgi:hypothetical protein